MDYPKERELDGIYFRVKREDRWRNICFSDMTVEEREIVTSGRSSEWIKSLAYRLADVIREIGDQFEIERAKSCDKESE